MSATQDENTILIDTELLELQIENNRNTQEQFISDQINLNQLNNQADLNRALIEACKNQKINEANVENLLRKGADPSTTDTEWYNWTPLHYTAYNTNPKKMKIICQHQSEINYLSNISENALHVLLGHSKKCQHLKICMQNKHHLKMVQMIRKEPGDVLKCLMILLEYGININHSDFWNQTPILLALRLKYHQTVEFLLRTKEIDLDSCRDSISNKTPRELLSSKMNVTTYPTFEPTLDTYLFQLLKSKQTEKFCKMKKNLNALDGNTDLLQFCMRKSLLYWYQALKKLKSCSYVPENEIHKCLDFFVQDDYSKCILHLLDNGFSGHSILSSAIEKAYHPLVALILGQENVHFEAEIMIKAVELMLLNDSIGEEHLNHTLSLVLLRLHEDRYDGLGFRKIFELSSKRCNNDNMLLLLESGGALCWVKDQRSLLEDIDPIVLKNHLDGCIDQDRLVDSRSLLHDNSFVTVLEIFSKSLHLEEFLNHSVFKILVARHWEHFQFKGVKYFYLNFIFFILFYLLLNVFIISKFNDFSHPILSIFTWTFLLVFIIKEVVQIVSNFLLYFKEPSNYVEFIFITSTWLVLCFNFQQIDIFEVVSILSGNFVLLLLVLSVPELSRYIIILQSIFFYLRYLLFYCIQFIAFALSFYILLAPKNQQFFIEIPNKIFETLILFTGNLDYMETPWKSNNYTLFHDFPHKEVITKIVFTLFVIFLAIILQNLLLGLLVFDTDSLLKKVELAKQRKRVEFVLRLEHYFGRVLGRWQRHLRLELNEKVASDWWVSKEAGRNGVGGRKRRRGNLLRTWRKFIVAKINERI